MVTLPIIMGEPEEGFSFVTMNELPLKPMLWFCRAIKNGSTLKFQLTFKNNQYTLWRKKRKGQGKMVGVGWEINGTTQERDMNATV
jgi:hypothetical protein